MEEIEKITQQINNIKELIEYFKVQNEILHEKIESLGLRFTLIYRFSFESDIRELNKNLDNLRIKLSKARGE